MGSDTEIPVDNDFEILYPPVDAVLRDGEELYIAKAKTLAEQWSSLNVKEVIARIAFIESEAESAGLQSWPRYTPVICQEIASQVENIKEWHLIAIKAKLPADLITRFYTKMNS